MIYGKLEDHRLSKRFPTRFNKREHTFFKNNSYMILSYIVTTRKLTEYGYVSEYVGIETRYLVLAVLSEGIA